MGFKSILGKIGKVALTAAPYVAAPFTGGASLMATDLANKAVQRWSEHDANAAIAKGLAPSHFDQVLGKVGTISSLASAAIPTGALGKIGMLGKAAKLGKAAETTSKVAKTASILGKVKKSADLAAPLISAAVNSNRGQSQPQQSYTQPTNLGIGPTNSPVQQYNTTDALARGRARALAARQQAVPY